MLRHAIAAGIELGGGDNGKFEMARLQALARFELEQKLAQMLERRGYMREHGSLLAKGPVVQDEVLVDAGVLGWQRARGQQRHAGHHLSSSVAPQGPDVPAASRCRPPWPPALPTSYAPMPPR